MSRDTVLIVDDEPANLTILRRILEGDYNLMFARSGAEALALANEHRPGLVLLDVQMPEMDGYAVCRALKANPRSEAIQVIFVTALAEMEDEEAGFDAGGVDYITKPVSPRIVRARVRAHLSLVNVSRLERSHRDAIFMLGEAGHYNDCDTGMHIWRMAAFASRLAEASGWSKERCALLELAAPMHDTGKIGIPDAVLRKPGKLDPQEWVIMKSHTRIGYEILSKSDEPVFQLAADIALHHHEKWDGSGYPFGLAGQSIPESARIAAIADVFDALTMKRPYKDAWSIERAVRAIVDGSGHHFDPSLVELFEASVPEIVEIKARWDRLEAHESQAA